MTEQVNESNKGEDNEGWKVWTTLKHEYGQATASIAPLWRNRHDDINDR